MSTQAIKCIYYYFCLYKHKLRNNLQSTPIWIHESHENKYLPSNSIIIYFLWDSSHKLQMFSGTIGVQGKSSHMEIIEVIEGLIQ